MNRAKTFSLQKTSDVLVFYTSTYRVEKSSVLHGGIYNYEFSSILSASAVCGMVYVLVSMKYRVGMNFVAVLAFVFITSFILFRRFLFRERTLKAVFDRDKGIITIYNPRILGYISEDILMDDLESIEVGTIRYSADNRDAVQFVQKISLQHGSAVPGLGEEQEFVTLFLKLRDGGERMIYAARIEGRVDGEPDLPLKEIQEFLKGIRCRKGTTSGRY